MSVVIRDNGGVVARVATGHECGRFATSTLVIRLSGRTDGQTVTATGRSRLRSGTVRATLDGHAHAGRDHRARAAPAARLLLVHAVVRPAWACRSGGCACRPGGGLAAARPDRSVRGRHPAPGVDPRREERSDLRVLAGDAEAPPRLCPAAQRDAADDGQARRHVQPHRDVHDPLRRRARPSATGSRFEGPVRGGRRGGDAARAVA